MGMLVTSFENALLGLIFRNADITDIGDSGGLLGSETAGSLYFSACTAWPGETPDQESEEATYTGYTRTGVARDTSSWGAPSNGTISPAAAISFGERSDAGAAQELQYFIIGTDSSGAGNALAWGVFGDATFAVRPFLVVDTDNDDIIIPGHGLSANDRIAFFPFEAAGSLPTGLTAGTVYHVISTGIATDSFRVSETQGGSSVAISAVGGGIAAKVRPISVTQNVEPQLKTTTVIRFS